MSLGALGDSYFEYLLKAWIQSGQVDDEARVMCKLRLDSVPWSRVTHDLPVPCR